MIPLASFHVFVSPKKQHSLAETTVTKKGETIYMIPHAMALQEAGIKFKKREVEGGSILDVKFNDGVMEIPPLLIDASTKSLFRNYHCVQTVLPLHRG